MSDEGSSLRTGRLARFASMARAGVGTAVSIARGSTSGLEVAVDRLGELRGLGTKVGQMAGLVEANLPDDMRKTVGPALAKLRDKTATSPYAAVSALVREELGSPPEEAFARFDPKPFASASLGQVHDATTHDGRHVAVKVQHPGIREAFTGDLANVGALGGVATTFLMPEGAGKDFITGVKSGFLAELDYRTEAEHQRRFRAIVAGDADLFVPDVVGDRSTARVLTTEFAEGRAVEHAQGFDDEEKLRLARAVRRFVIGSLIDKGVLYADAHAGNFLFREGEPVTVLDFGSVFDLGPDVRDLYRRVARLSVRPIDAEFEAAIGELLRVSDPVLRSAMAGVQHAVFGGLVRGDRIDRSHVRTITERITTLKREFPGRKAAPPFFMPFVMRTLLASNALLSALEAPALGPYEIAP